MIFDVGIVLDLEDEALGSVIEKDSVFLDFVAVDLQDVSFFLLHFIQVHLTLFMIFIY